MLSSFLISLLLAYPWIGYKTSNSSSRLNNRFHKSGLYLSLVIYQHWRGGRGGREGRGGRGGRGEKGGEGRGDTFLSTLERDQNVIKYRSSPMYVKR